jgi:hypothetical protein
MLFHRRNVGAAKLASACHLGAAGPVGFVRSGGRFTDSSSRAPALAELACYPQR